MDLKIDLREMSRRLGADLFGVASAEALCNAPNGHRPTDILADAESVIVLGMKMLDAQTDILSTEEGDYFNMSPRQDMFQGHNSLLSQELDRVGYAMARFLEKKGFKAYHQMASKGGTDKRYLTGLLSLKHMAVQAGLGVFGHNSLLITPQYGPRVRLTAIITDAAIPSDTPLTSDFCKDCRNPCISLCPVDALKKPGHNSPYEIDKYACAQYLTTRPTCSVCLKVCPRGDQRIT